jgi:toxin ParE1/3/4
MALSIRPEIEEQLVALAGVTGRSPQELTDEALRHFVEREAEIVTKIRRGIEAADRGEVVSHGAVIQKLKARLDKTRWSARVELVWTVPAEAELLAIFDYIANENPTAAERMLDEIQNAASKLELLPLLGRPGRVAGTRELVISRTPYILAYRVSATQVTVLHVFHGAQQWPEEF